MLSNAIGYVAVLAVMVALDAVYLTQVGGPIFKQVLGPMLADKMRVGPAIGFYLLYAVGVMVLAAAPAVAAGEWKRAALAGAVLGLVAYGAYDLTNMATLKTWSVRLTLVDMAWGTFATALAATAGFWAVRALARAV